MLIVAMNPARLACLVMGLLVAISTADAKNPFSFFSSPSGDVFIVTDVSDAGRAFQPPTKDNPIHCVALNFGCSFGSMTGDRLPDAAKMSAFVAKVIADQGYQGSDEAHPPELLLTIQWGYLRGGAGANLIFLGGDKLGVTVDQGPLRDFVGNITPDVARGPAAAKVKDLAKRDLYVMTICAFDHAAYLAGRAEVLWKTRIAASTTGRSMAQALPDMVVMAGPAIGRETTKVIVANPADKREGRVDFGELEVIGEESAPAPSNREK